MKNPFLFDSGCRETVLNGKKSHDSPTCLFIEREIFQGFVDVYDGDDDENISGVQIQMD